MAALLDIVKKNATSRSVTIRIIDSTDGTPETGVVFNTAGIDLWYRREDAAVVSITEADLTTPALTDTWETGGFLHISHGEYRLDVPDAAFATGANHVDIGGTVTGMVVIGGRVRLVDYDPEDASRLGLTAMPDAVPGATGGIFIAGTNAATSITTALTANIIGDITGTLATVTTCTTTTTNSDMVGTNGASTHSAADVYTAFGTGGNLTTCATAAGFSTHSAADVYTAFGTGGNLTTCATATGFSTHDAAAVKTAIEADGSKLDHIWETTEDDTGVRRFTTNALEQAPSGSGGDATEAKQDTIITHLTDVKGTAFVKDTDSLIDLAHTGADGDTLETLSDQIDTIEGGTGSGARTVAVTVDDGSDPLENATVRFTEGVNTYVGATDASGEISFSLDDATYAVAVSKPGYSFTPTTLIVDGDETETYSMAAVSISAPPNASTTTGVMTVYDEEGSVEESVEVSVQIIDGPGTDGIGYDSTVWTETSDADGIVQFAGIVHGARYKIWRGDSKPNAQTFTAPTSGDSFDLAEVIGRG